MKKLLIGLLVVLGSLAAHAQPKFVSGITVEAVLKAPHGTSLPMTCGDGDLFVKTDATSGQRLYACEGDTWVQQAGGGGGSFPSITDDGSTVALDADVEISGALAVGGGSAFKMSGPQGDGSGCGDPSGGANCGHFDSTSDTLQVYGNGVTKSGTVPSKTCTSNQFLSSVVIDAAFASIMNCGAPTRSVDPTFWAANCGYSAGGTVCGTGFYAVGSCPTPTAVSGTNTGYGVLRFPDSDGDCDIQTQYRLTGWDASTIQAVFTWKTGATSGDVVWQIATACVATGESRDPSFNSFQTVTDTAAGTANYENIATISSLTTTGCAAGETLFLKVRRNRTHASDSISGTVDLISLQILASRSL